MAYIKREAVIAQDKPIFYNLNHHKTPYTVDVYGTDILADENGDKQLPPGMFVVKIAEVARFLARSTVATAFSTSSTSGKLNTPFQTFKVNDVLHLVEPFGTIALGGTYLNTEIVKVTIGGYVLNVVTGSTDNAVIGNTVAAAINANPSIYALVRAISDNAGTIYLYGRDGITAHTLVVAARNAADSGASAAGTATASASTLTVSNTAIGTITAIATDGTVTLAANAGINVPVGARVGVRFTQALGLYGHSIDFKVKPVNTIAPVVEATGVYETNLPYIDEDLRRRFPQLLINKKFA